MASKSIAQQQQDRKARGAALAAAGKVRHDATDDGLYRIAGKPYQVSLGNCTCPDWQRRGDMLGTCKHQEAAITLRTCERRVERALTDGELDELIGKTVCRLGWEQDDVTRDYLTVLLDVARQEQAALLEVA